MVGRLLYGIAFSNVVQVLVLFDFQAAQAWCLFVANLTNKYKSGFYSRFIIILHFLMDYSCHRELAVSGVISEITDMV